MAQDLELQIVSRLNEIVRELRCKGWYASTGNQRRVSAMTHVMSPLRLGVRFILWDFAARLHFHKLSPIIVALPENC